MARSLADGRTKFALLTTKPADPFAPTVTELEAGIDASCAVLSSDFNIGPAASEGIDEKALCQEGNAQAPGASNATVEFSPFREFDETGKALVGGVDGEIGDAVFQATKHKGVRLWAYIRETSKKSTDPWAAGDEVNGFEFITDNPQYLERTGYVKRKVTGFFQDLFMNGEVAATAGG